MRPLHRYTSAFVLAALSACGRPLDDSPPDGGGGAPGAAADLVAIATERGFTGPSIAFIEHAASPRGVQRYDVAYDGVRIEQIGGTRRAGRPAGFSHVTLALDAAPITQAVLTQADAEARAVAASSSMGDARVLRSELVLVPRIERRLRAGVAPPGATATDFERVVRRLDLRWRVALEVTSGGVRSHWSVPIDAVTGAADPAERTDVALCTPGDTDCVDGVGNSTWSGTHQLELEPSSTTYVLDDSNGNYVTAFADDGSKTPEYESDSKVFGDGDLYHRLDPLSVNGQTAAVDAALAESATWALFHDVFAMDGIDGAGLRAHVRVHLHDENAYWDPEDGEVWAGYVDLDEAQLRPLTAVDVIGHELGHAYFLAATAENPAGRHDETEGLNEGSGDIIGTLAENYRFVAWGEDSTTPRGQIPPSGNWTMGEATLTTYRSMVKPKFPEWSPYLVTNAHGDAHLIAGPIDRMFYALVTGLGPYTGTWLPTTSPHLPNGMAGVGLTKAGLMWRDVVDGLHPGDDFAAAREDGLAVMDAIHGWDSNEKKDLADAFAAVNIGPPADRVPPKFTAAAAKQVTAPAPAERISWTIDERPTRKLPVATVDGLAYMGVFQGGLYPMSSYQVDVPLKFLATGSHTAVITAWDDWGNATNKIVTFNVDHTGPTMSLSASATGKITTVTATVSDPSGIARVDFHRDGALAGSVTTAPYKWTFDSSSWSDGAHAIDVSAIDTFGNGAGATISITADNTPPTVSVTIGGGAPPFTITGTATDASAIVKAQILRDSTALATATGLPITASYAPQDALSHTIVVRAYDALGNVGQATVAAPRDTVPPTVTFHETQVQYAVTLAGAVTDPCGVASPLWIYADNVLIAQPTGPIYSVALPTGLFAPGLHTFRLTADDRCGNHTSYTSTFPVYTNPPLVSIDTLQGPDHKHPRVVATVTHDRPIDHVEVRRASGGPPATVATDSTPPYDMTIDTSTWEDGVDDIQVIAYDNVGWPGIATATVFADNTGPVVHSVWQQEGNSRTVDFTVDAVSDGFGSGLVDVSLAVTLFSPIEVFTHPPYLIKVTLPPGWVQADFIYSAVATDLYGNAGGDSFVITVACSKPPDGPETCSARRK
ncbi:MAG TPA: Ig-like domain-containing protein [Kofleriaceae bacterium]|nr:Ig-like domain-containing protein [Kofleriaceae bacterium]